MKKLYAFTIGLFLTVPAFADVLRTVQAGATDVSVDLKIIDSVAGTPETGVLFNTAGIDLEYCRDKAACVDITEAALTTPALTDAHEEGGFIEKGYGNYRLDLPDLAVASGVGFVTIQGTVTDMIVIGGIVELTEVNSTSANLFIPSTISKPLTGSNTYSFRLHVKGPTGAMVDADSAPTINTLTDIAGTDLTGRLGSTTATKLAEGIYEWVYTSTSTDDSETIEAEVFVTIDGAVRNIFAHSRVDVLTDTRATQASLDALNDLSAAEVNTEVDTALTDIHLDHLLAADYDPATPPGVATAWMNELVESDGGVTRFTVNALENGPSGSGASAAAIADAVWDEAQADHVTAGSFGVTASEIASILEDTAAIPAFPTNFADLDIEVTTGHVDVGFWNGAEITTALEDSSDIATAVSTELGTGTGFTAIPWNASWDTEVQSEANDALVANHLDHLFGADYDPATPPGVATAWANELVESDAGITRFTINALENAPSGSGASAEAIADAVWDEAQADHVAVGSFGITASEIASIAAAQTTAQNDLDIITGSNGALLADDAITAGKIAADAIGAAELAAGATTEIRDAIMQYTLDNGITFEEAACHMLSVLAGEAAFTAGSPDQGVFSDPTGTDTRVTVTYGTDAGDRTAITLSATNCGSN